MSSEIITPRIITPEEARRNDEMVRAVFSQEPNTPPDTAVELFINDVSLRDGQQAERYSPTVEEAVAYARALVRFGIQGIEAGNAPAGDTERDKVIAIAEQVGSMELPVQSQYGVHPRITSLARLSHADVVKALASVQGAPNRGVHAYMAHSEKQFPFKFDSLRKEHGLTSTDYGAFIRDIVYPTIEREFGYIKDKDPECQIRYSPEDWTRTRPEVAIGIALHAAKCGATEINLPDTLGVGNPFIIRMGIEQMRRALDEEGFENVQIVFHGHDDGDMSAANSMGAILGGARQVDVTGLGMGERGGNNSAESLLFMLETQRPFMERELGVQITDTLVRALTMETATICAETFRREIPEDTPIVGRRQRQQRAGVHQAAHWAGQKAGVETVYCPIDLKKYGVKTEYIIGPESGKGGLEQVMTHMKLPFRGEDLTAFAVRMKAYCNKHRLDLDQDELAEHIYYPTIVEITGGDFITKVKEMKPKGGRIAVEITTREGQIIEGIATSEGEGEIDAIMDGLRQIIPGIEITRDGFHTRTTDVGSDAAAVSTFTIRNAREVTQSATDTNTQLAERRALIRTFNAIKTAHDYQAIVDGPPAE